MDGSLDIAQVARRTGLTARALRHYEARGLLRPGRSASGRRLYGAGDLERIAHILTLKRAGLGLAQIGAVLAGRQTDLAGLIDAQLVALSGRQRALDEAREALSAARARLESGAPIDAAAFCALIRRNEAAFSDEAGWSRIAARYLSADDQADWARRRAAAPHAFDDPDYGRRWADLGRRIGEALPMDPASPQAQDFVRQWFALLGPFAAAATPAMLGGVQRMYDDMESWAGELDPGFGRPVWDFMKLAVAARIASGAGPGEDEA